MYALRYALGSCMLRRLKPSSGQLSGMKCSQQIHNSLPETIDKLITPPPPDIYKKFDGIKPIYFFPQISVCTWVLNLKKYIIPFYIILTVSTSAAVEMDMLAASEVYTVLLIEALVYINIILLGLPFVNFVGRMYVNPNNELVVSHLNFWGHRVDKKFGKGELYLESRQKGWLQLIKRDKHYLLLNSRNSSTTFKIHIEHAKILDEDLFTQLVGEIPESVVD